jgi:putative transposase
VSHATPGPIARQVANTCRDLVAQPGLPLARHLPAAQVHDTFRDLGGAFRQRLYTPAVTLWTFLHQALDPDHSCQQAVDRLLAYRAACGLPDCSDDTGAYCRARARLPEELPHELVRQTGRAEVGKADEQWLWKGRRVKVVDGTGLSMPDTPENQRGYPQPQQVQPGLGFPLMRLVVVFCLAVGTALDAAMGRWSGEGTGEVSLFRQLDDVLDPGDVLLADRIYSGFWDVARARARGADVVLRRHAGRKAVKFRGRGDRSGSQREGWRKPARPAWMAPEEYESYPEWIKMRVLRVVVRVRGFRAKRLVLATTLLDGRAYSCDDLAELYRRRWQAELNLRSLKVVLQMDVLRGKSPGVVRKEVWLHLLAYNVVRRLMAQAAASAGVRPDQLSFTGALHAVNAFLPRLQGAGTGAEAGQLWSRLLRLIGRRRVGQRPNRYEPRKVKRRPKGHAWLTVPRAEERRRLRDGTSEEVTKAYGL